MSPLDAINGSFEAGGAVMSLQNCRRLWRDRRVAGLDWRVWIWFAAWGWWNLFYYPLLGQWFSTAAGGALVLGNTVWVILAWRYRKCS